jgi:hypothetical protein
MDQALSRKSGLPKLPDFRASATSGAPIDRVHGTPGSISGPIRKARTPSAPTTAPEVSPPATMNREKPRPSSVRPTSARSSSTIAPARSWPSRSCTAPTDAGSALE